MNRDIEAFPEQFFAWLLKSDQQIGSSTGKQNSGAKTPTEDFPCPELDDSDLEKWEDDDLDLLESEVLNATLSSTTEEPAVLHQPKRPGDIPAVRDRFQAILKRRLKAEIQHSPPLFPWENSISDYEPDRLAKVEAEPLSEFYLWTAQQENLKLPVSIPPKIFVQLLERSQAVTQSSRSEAAKLVRAVEALFPGQSQVLNKFAQKVLTTAACKNSQPPEFFPKSSKFPLNYEAATLAEQMVLLLLAAWQLIDSLTLNLSPNQLSVERQWLTTVGLLTLNAQYRIENQLIRSIRIEGNIPCGGSFKFQGGQSQASSHRPDPGRLSVELFDLESNQTYPLEVQLQQLGQKPLIFAVLVEEDRG